MFNNIFEEIITLNLKDINENLITLSKIKLNDKLYNDEKKIYLEDSYIPSIKRWYRGSDRHNANKFIKYVLTQAFFQSELLKKRQDIESIILHNTLLNNLKNSINGLINLQKTYSSDLDASYEIQKNINYINKFFS